MSDVSSAKRSPKRVQELERIAAGGVTAFSATPWHRSAVTNTLAIPHRMAVSSVRGVRQRPSTEGMATTSAGGPVMKRRTFLTQAGVGLATTAIAAPAIAQPAPQVKWRLASSFPKSLDTIYGAGAFFCERVGKLTEGKFEITPYAAGQIVPPLQVLDAVQQGTVECGHTASYYYVGKNKAFAFGCAIPFGLTSRQQSAWEYAGGGLELLQGLLQGIRDHPLPCRQHRDADGRLVQEGDQDGRGPEGSEDAHPRDRRRGHGAPGCGAAGVAGKRNLRSAGARGHRCGRVGRPLRRREARSLQDRQALLLSGILGGRHGACCHDQRRGMGQAAQDSIRRRSSPLPPRPMSRCRRSTTPRTRSLSRV